ncbi:acyl-CoA/acyl-ACP dehydrogenase [Thermoleophilum album]|jgi:alkylation response protein AidB-like acyl-CoA dehydrogenase|uniref:acyl-CoA dehydrogenase family protein n=1 Tax=Thermoleophilum album TaxID=29539 RepID=UPI00237CE8E0|nr:acyl-CoA dehydrogenase family protein [Thermoleophilum album]WDT93251.1 acyl-CoA/acyl-ACP dehydrogenase [Thermoleophilum album]
MNFDFNDDQQAIKRTARELLAARFSAERVRELAEGRRYDEEAWAELCQLGWPGIFVAEEYGGQGLGTVELVILAEELGYALAPVPFLSRAAAGLVIASAGSEEQRRRWLAPIARGELAATLAVVHNGAGRLVPDATEAELVVAVGQGRARVYERGSFTAEELDTIDLTRRYARVRLVGAGEPLAGDAEPGFNRALVALSAELVGVAQRALEMAVAYARERKQFGRPIGAYQAVSHRLAQMLLETESARSLTYYAAWAADAEPESLELAAAMAKAYASDAGWRTTAQALQVFGGIGFTWEHDLHFFLKRARTDAHLWARGRELRDRVADLAGLAA